MQPVSQFLDRTMLSANPHFDIAVRQVDGMPVKVQRPGDITGTGAKEDSLYAA